MKNISSAIRALSLVATFSLTTISSQAFAQTTGAAGTSTSNSSGLFSKEKWAAGYFNYMNGPTFSEATGSSINHYLSVKHKITPDWAVGFTLRPDSNFDKTNPTMTMDDPYFTLNYPNIFNNFGIKLKGDVRYFVPVSDKSKEANLAGAVTTRLYASSTIGRLDLLYILIPKVFINNETTDGQKIFSHAHYISSSFTMSPFWSIDFAVSPAWTLKRNAESTFNDLPAYPGFTMNFSENLSLSPYLEIPLMDNKLSTTSAGAALSYTLL